MAFKIQLLSLFAFILFVGHSMQQSNNSTSCSMESSFGDCNNATAANNHTSNSSRACVPFLYSGCGGNENNFESYEECRETCGGPQF